MKTLTFLISLLISAATQANLCEQNVEDVIQYYSDNNTPVESYQIKDCSEVTADMPHIMYAHEKTNAPKVTETNACIIILNMPNGLQQFAVYDDLTGYYLKRNFENDEYETTSISRFGDTETGTALYSIHYGKKGKCEDGFLKSTDSITKVNYDFENDTARLLQWKVEWFSVKYSHDYTVQCQ